MGEMLNFTQIPFKIDFCTIRGQEYYTGPVFEMDIRSGSSIYPKIAGGGRYDQLMSKFLQTDSISVPAIGFAYGLERLLNVLSHEGMGECGSSAKYFLDGKRMDYVIFPKNLRKAWKAAEEMRGRWNRVGLYYLDDDIARAKKYAERVGAVFLEI
jgi:histidyl-tRNA synthetase